MEGIVVNKENKRLLLTIIIGLIITCVGAIAMFSSFNYIAKAEGESTAMIVVDAGATTTIMGGTVGAMENGNSIYIADTGVLNMTGGTVEGNIYNAGTFNYTAGSVASVTLASGKYITFKGAPTTAISITLDNPVVGEKVGYLSGITTLDLTLLSVNNLPANTKLKIVDSYIQVAMKIREVTITADPSEYGSVDISSLSVISGEAITIVDNTLTYGETIITATPAEQTDQYTYTFDGFYVGDEQISESVLIEEDTAITAKFTATLRTYTVTLTRNSSSYGTLSAYSVTDVPYGATIKRGTSTTKLEIIDVDGTTAIATITATPASSTSSYTYSFSSWRQTTSSGTTITTTGFTLTGDITIYAVFSRTAVQPSYFAGVSPYYGPSTITMVKEGTAGTVGGTVTMTFPYATITQSSDGSRIVASTVSGTAVITAKANSGYTFAGWYSSNTATTPVSTNSSYTIAVTKVSSDRAINTLFALFLSTSTSFISNITTEQDCSNIANMGSSSYGEVSIGNCNRDMLRYNDIKMDFEVSDIIKRKYKEY